MLFDKNLLQVWPIKLLWSCKSKVATGKDVELVRTLVAAPVARRQQHDPAYSHLH